MRVWPLTPGLRFSHGSPVLSLRGTHLGLQDRVMHVNYLRTFLLRRLILLAMHRASIKLETVRVFVSSLALLFFVHYNYIDIYYYRIHSLIKGVLGFWVEL